jgi:hypothetical protein
MNPIRADMASTNQRKFSITVPDVNVASRESQSRPVSIQIESINEMGESSQLQTNCQISRVAEPSQVDVLCQWSGLDGYLYEMMTTFFYQREVLDLNSAPTLSQSQSRTSVLLKYVTEPSLSAFFVPEGEAWSAVSGVECNSIESGSAL